MQRLTVEKLAKQHKILRLKALKKIDDYCKKRNSDCDIRKFTMK